MPSKSLIACIVRVMRIELYLEKLLCNNRLFSNCIADLCPLEFRICILMTGRLLEINMNIYFECLNPSRYSI